MPTKQETFDIVVRALRAQGQPSVIEYISRMRCKYRLTKEGVMLKCAAGHLIPDESYDPYMEDQSVSSPNVKAVLVTQGHEVGFVAVLQRCHDDPASSPIDGETWWESFAREVRQVAADFGLDASALDVP